MTPLDLANVLKLTKDYREISWNGHRYTEDWYACAFRALTELKQPTEFATPLSVMLYPEYVDIWDWVEQIIEASSVLS